jgi:uncharacterized protein (AIM24 family)
VVFRMIDVAKHRYRMVMHEGRVAMRELVVATQDTGDVLTHTRQSHVRAAWPRREP